MLTTIADSSDLIQIAIPVATANPEATQLVDIPERGQLVIACVRSNDDGTEWWSEIYDPITNQRAEYLDGEAKPHATQESARTEAEAVVKRFPSGSSVLWK